MPTAHLIHGYIGAGKTTFARGLEQQRGAVRFSHDDWMSALYGRDPPIEIFAEYATRISCVMQRLWTRCLVLGVDVVLDFGFWARSERDAVRQVIASLNADCCLYRLETSDDVAWPRVADRNMDLQAGLFIARDTFDSLKARFEPLDADEPRIDIPAGWKDDDRWTPRPSDR